MEYKILGNTGVEVSKLCLGTMTFGGPADEKESASMFKLSLRGNQCMGYGGPNWMAGSWSLCSC